MTAFSSLGGLFIRIPFVKNCRIMLCLFISSNSSKNKSSLLDPRFNNTHLLNQHLRGNQPSDRLRPHPLVLPQLWVRLDSLPLALRRLLDPTPPRALPLEAQVC